MEEETLEAIKKNLEVGERQLKILAEDISKARKAGIDVTEQEKRYNELSRRLATMRAVYLP